MIAKMVITQVEPRWAGGGTLSAGVEREGGRATLQAELRGAGLFVGDFANLCIRILLVSTSHINDNKLHSSRYEINIMT